jgi:hypothetical protein
VSGVWHYGRSFPPNHFIEDNCPCPKAPCGLVIPSESCPEHAVAAMKTIRQAHAESSCPALASDDPELFPDPRTTEPVPF